MELVLNAFEIVLCNCKVLLPRSVTVIIAHFLKCQTHTGKISSMKISTSNAIA